MMTNKEFAEKLKDIATKYKTLYVMGCFGAPMTEANKKRYCNNHSYNKDATRTAMIKAASADTFGFDCVCLIKGVLWGWCGDKNRTYGGAGYAINGVPDIGADTMITKCSGVSTDFSKIEIGEAVWMSGHIGVYVGNGLAVECTPKWENKVQITACNCSKSGYNRRNWTKHGKLPYISYVAEEEKAETPAAEKPQTTTETTADSYNVGEIVNFAGGNHYTNASAASGKSVKASLAKVTNKYKSGKHPLHLRAVNAEGKYISGVYGWVDLSTVSKKESAAAPKKTVDELAREVINGKWGNGTDRKNKLTAAGYDYSAVQKRVNELCSQQTAAEPKKTVDELAREVINGKWGNGTDRKNRLTAAGYDYSAVQKRVNELLK